MEELDLKELFSLFWSKKAVILLLIIISIFFGMIYSYFLVTPEYTASTDLILVQSSTSQTVETGITSADLTVNSKLVSTYSDIIKRDAILGQVASNLNIEQEEIEKIRNKISANTVKDTEIIEISVRDEDPNYAAKIANEIATVFCEKIVDIYNISNTYLLDRAKIPTVPSNVNHIKDIVIFAFIGMAISVAYVFVMNMLDNTIKTEEDIEKVTGIVALVSIPNYEVEFKDVKGGRR